MLDIPTTAELVFWGLTFELSGDRREGALAAGGMMNHTRKRPAWLAGGRPLERRVRPASMRVPVPPLVGDTQGR